MKITNLTKTKSLLLFVVVLITCVFLAFSSVSSAKSEETDNILSSSGSASLNAEPDTAIFSLAVETEKKLLSEAITENNQKANKVVEEVKKLLDKGDSIKTAAFNVNPVYNYDNKERKSLLIGYRVTNMVTIKTKKILEVGKFMDKALSSGANRADSLDFIVENRTKYSEQLLKQAAEEAKKKALATAKVLDIKIKGVKNVSTNFSDEPIYSNYRGVYASMEMKSASDGSTPPIESGEVKLQASVSVDFIIEDAGAKN